MSGFARQTARLIGLSIGVGMAAAFLLVGRVPASTADRPAELKLDLGRSGELVVSPRRPLLDVHRLKPGGSAKGRALLWNPTRIPLSVRPRVVRGSSLDRIVRVRLRVDGERAYDGTLGGLRTNGAAPFSIAPGERRRIVLSAWLPRGAKGHDARRVHAALELTTTAGAR